MATISSEAAALDRIHYQPGSSVLILADSEEGRARLARAAQLAGCRVAASSPIEGGSDRLGAQVSADAVLLHLSSDHGAEQDRMLALLAEGARDGCCGGLVVAPRDLLDAIAALTLDSAVQHLCDPDDLMLVTAVALATARPSARLHDAGKSPATARLQQLSEEVGRVATILAALSEDEAAATALVGGDCRESGPEAIEAGQIRAIIRARRLRDHYFRGELFADPAWDMLLDLMAARIERQKVAVSSLCIAAAVPPTTALRWIKALCDQGLFRRIADPEDGRRVFIELADETAAALENYLKAALRISPLIL